jgi:hypothetical protein
MSRVGFALKGLVVTPIESGFAAALGLTADGLVTEYGTTWRRRDWSGP